MPKDLRSYLAELGMPIALAMPAAGFYPRGGGRLEAWIEPATPRPWTRLERGPLARLRGLAGVSQLNPGIADPNRLTPGQRVRIFIPRRAPAAQVARVSRKVEAQASPIPWEDARIGDLLLERDGVRTFPRSSAEMAFPDGT